MISPGSFPANGTDPLNANSCQLDWGTVEGDEFVEDIICAGITGPYGTGPFVFDSRDTRTVGDEEIDTKVVFVANENYWGGAPAVKRLEVIYYETSDDVKADLLNGNLDVVWGSGVLPDEDIKDIRDSPEYQETIRVFHSGPLQNVILILNSGVPPFDDINVRKTVVHAINKAAIVNKNFMVCNKLSTTSSPLKHHFVMLT